MPIRHDARVLIVGGGATGAGLDHDLVPKTARRLDLALRVVGTLTVAYGMGLLITLAARS